MATPYILVDVDTQIDFMAADGALSVPGAEAIEHALAALVALAAKHGLPHWSTMDTHTPDDPEFAAYGFPPHCVKGTAGWSKVASTRPVAPALVLEEAEAVGPAREKVFLKDTFDIFTNPLFTRALAAAGPTTAIVCGVATDFCVKAAVLGLRAAGVSVVVAEDAIAAVSAEGGETAIAAMKAAGATFRNVEAIASQLAREVAHVA